MPASEIFFRQYIATMLWAEGPHDIEGDDRSFQDRGFTIDNVSEHLTTELRAVCDRFCDENAADLELWREEFGSDTEAAHDFWLSSQGHGTGFWDRFNNKHPLSVVGRRLNTASKPYQVDVYLGDNGQVEGML